MRYAAARMAGAGFRNIPLRYIGVAVAFVLTTVIAYQVGRRRAPEPTEPAAQGDSADTTAPQIQTYRSIGYRKPGFPHACARRLSGNCQS